MDLEEVLLDDQSRLKLSILAYVIDHPERTIYYSDINNHFDISRLKYNLLIGEMNKEIKEQFGFAFKKNNHTVYLEQNQVCFNEYMRFLIRRGLPYQFVLASLVDDEGDIEPFLMDHFVSRSTVTRALKTLKKYTNELGIKINFSKVSFTGDEGMLRFLYLKVLWLGSLGEDVSQFFSDVSIEKRFVAQLGSTVFSNIASNLLELHLLISRIRMKKGFDLAPSYGCEDLYPEYTQLIASYYQTITEDQEQINYLINSFKYQFIFAFYYSSDEDSRLPALEQFYKELKKKEPIFSQFIQGFIASCQQNLFNETLSNKSQANLFSVIFLHYLTNGSMLMFLGFNFDEARQIKRYKMEKVTDIRREIENYLKPYLRKANFSWLKNHFAELTQSLTLLMYPYYKKETEEKVNVVIIPVLNYLAIQQVVFFLDTLDFIHYSTNTKDVPQADLILSNFSENVQSIDKPTFIFQMNNPEQNLVDLFRLLWQTYLKKNA